MSLATGGQILMTRFAFDSARSMLKGEDIPGNRPLGLDEPRPLSVEGNR